MKTEEKSSAALWNGARKAFITDQQPADEDLTPSLLINDPEQGKKVYLAIEEELKRCESFDLSVAFITRSGLQLLKPVLQNLERRGIRGRILTTDYLHFSQPDALDLLDSFSNIDLRLYRCGAQDGFHTKGYFFFRQDSLTMIIGSSNLTDAALCASREWNARLLSSYQGVFAQECLERFQALYTDENTFAYRQIRQIYRDEYEIMQNQKKTVLQNGRILTWNRPIVPNSMQRELIHSLQKLVDAGEKRALLVSATATGKTYAAALAVQALCRGRVLFLVHREQIARKAMESFRRVLGDAFSYGLLSGHSKDYSAQYLFSTIQTMSKQETLDRFAADAFDWIIIDEVHRAGAESYQKIFRHFDPFFWFGMSATPVRQDGFNIYELFDWNVACRISLRDAMEDDLLCPFHYYALEDLKIDDADHEDLRDFSRLLSEERIRHILDQTAYYGHGGRRLKGLMFVASKQEARSLSEALNRHGLRTQALLGKDSIEAREAAIARLVQEEDDENALDYLITVDIFNEGVDIPEVNQVVLLRPTQSAVVFTQQLGRGLRKSEDKEYVVVLDFIGLYSNNFMIPQALSEDRSGSKDRLRRFVQEGNRTLPGCSSIYFSEQAKRRIFKSIEKASMNSMQQLMEGWKSLYEQLGRIPDLVDFDPSQAMDPLLILSSDSIGCYQDFLKKWAAGHRKRTGESVPLAKLTEQETDFLRFVSQQWAGGKRPLEPWLLQALMDDGEDWAEGLERKADREGLKLNPQTWNCLLAQFEGRWLPEPQKSRWNRLGIRFLEPDRRDLPEGLDGRARCGVLRRTAAFEKALKNPDFRAALKDLCAFALQRWKRDCSRFEEGSWFSRNASYTYADSFRLLDFEVCPVAQNVGGYLYDRPRKRMPVYINYDKAEDIAASIAYEDHFEDPQRLIAFSKGKRTLSSPEIQALQQESDLYIPLFVRKNTNEKGSKEFYYLGAMKPDGHYEQKTLKNGHSVVEIGYRLDTPVRWDLYDYFTNT